MSAVYTDGLWKTDGQHMHSYVCERCLLLKVMLFSRLALYSILINAVRPPCVQLQCYLARADGLHRGNLLAVEFNGQQRGFDFRRQRRHGHERPPYIDACSGHPYTQSLLHFG